MSIIERSLIPYIVSIVKVVLVSGATTVTPQRSFSMARRIKTWLRSTKKQRIFNSLSILNSSKHLVDNLPLLKVAYEVVEKIPNHKRPIWFVYRERFKDPIASTTGQKP